MQILGADFCLALLRWEFPVSFKNLSSIKGVSISLLLFWIEHINGYKLKAYKLQSPSLVIIFFMDNSTETTRETVILDVSAQASGA